MPDSQLPVAGLPATAYTASVCRAKTLEPGQRGELALGVLTGSRSAAQAARDEGVSRQFVGAQVELARQAVQQAFEPDSARRGRAAVVLAAGHRSVDPAEIGDHLTEAPIRVGRAEFCQSGQNLLSQFVGHGNCSPIVGKSPNGLSKVPIQLNSNRLARQQLGNASRPRHTNRYQ